MLPWIFGISSYQLINIMATLLVIIYVSIFLKVKPKRYAIYTGIILAISEVVGGRLLFVLSNWERFFHFKTIFMLNYGFMDLGGAFLAFPVVLLISHKLFKIEYKQLFDVLVEALILSSAIIKLACFCVGCCGGVPTDLPWAIDGSHPTQLYEVAIWIIVYIVVILTKNKMNNINRVCLITIACILMRMPVEKLRIDFHMMIDIGYWVAYKVILAICAVVFIINNYKKIKDMFQKVKRFDNKN